MLMTSFITELLVLIAQLLIGLLFLAVAFGGLIIFVIGLAVYSDGEDGTGTVLMTVGGIWQVVVSIFLFSFI